MAVPRDEAHNLIASSRVEGTAVYRPDGEKIGRVEYVVMNFGGFLGMGSEHRPLPWDALEYSTDLGGYVVSAEDDKLKNSPSYGDDGEPAWDDVYRTRIYGYWGIPY
ncbi:PRC-barrel domain containing protein [Caenibius tardaugens NBRC 16725]|nr:PRC-barrel domain containing protein [Caenibius tardaugens NBRC 16725]